MKYKPFKFEVIYDTCLRITMYNLDLGYDIYLGQSDQEYDPRLLSDL